MEKIRILVYADGKDFTPTPGPLDGGLADMERFTKEKTKASADVSFTFVQRHGMDENGQEIHAQNRLTGELLSEHEEVWFFGIRQTDNEALGQPNNELTQPELDALAEFMQTKGVFVTGDHSSPDPTGNGGGCSEIGHPSFLGLGRALGHKIPRAGQLRIWKGPPTVCISGELSELDNFNTQEGSEPCQLDDPLLEIDSSAQRIELVRKECFPHRLFWYEDEDGNVTEIRRFPDHGHEGQVIVPDQLDGEWHIRSPRPEIVAMGRDKRFPNAPPRGIVAAYEGFEDEEHPERSAGRIVADSSFHHFIDYNLAALRDRDAAGMPVPGSDLDQVANFYGNLALWLAPRPARQRLKEDLLLRLANHIEVLEVIGNATWVIGRAANQVLNKTFGRAKVKTLFGPSGFEAFNAADELFSVVFLGESSVLPLRVEPPDLVLGKAIETCHQRYGVHANASFARREDDDLLGAIRGSIMSTLTESLRVLEDGRPMPPRA